MASLRDQLRAEKKCIDCRNPSVTQRCADCRKRVEANTERSRGHGKRGRMTKGAVDLIDMKFIGEAWSKAYTAFAEIERLMPMSPRKLEEQRGEPLAQVGMINKFSAEILQREGYIARLVRTDVAPSKQRKKTKGAFTEQLVFTWERP